MKCWLEASDSIGWNRCYLTTVWAGEDKVSLVISKHQSRETGLAEDMQALEQLGVSVDIQTDGAV